MKKNLHTIHKRRNTALLKFTIIMIHEVLTFLFSQHFPSTQFVVLSTKQSQVSMASISSKNITWICR